MRYLASALLLGTVLTGSAFAENAGITPFAFETLASRNAAFDRSAYVYPETHDLAGQINANAGDVRLDAIVVDGDHHAADTLQFVTGATIVEDDATDAERGGHNIAAGFGIGADLDPLVPEGVGTTTPTADSIVANQGNLNLSSIIAVRENVGTVIYEVAFDEPTDGLLLWERGNSGDIQVEALDDAGEVVGSYLVLDGRNDGDAPSDYTPTGIFVTTYVQDGFLNPGQQLSSVGLRLDTPAPRFRFTALQEAEGEGATRYDGPDLKILALPPSS